jgi:lactaldehyde dehydrogenase/glycolaldehyde dehydrogenase
MEIIRNEIFCPVLPIVKIRDFEEVIAYAKDCEYGLTSSIYTQHVDMMMAVNELKFGETYVNRENFEAMQGFHAGWRKSGIGGDDGMVLMNFLTPMLYILSTIRIRNKH